MDHPPHQGHAKAPALRCPHASCLADYPREAARYCEGDTILCKPHYLHYALTQAYELEDDQLGLFVGYAKADPQHDATILVQSSDGQLRGLIASQPQLYEQLIASRRATCYGLVRKANDDYCGEVCIRIR